MKISYNWLSEYIKIPFSPKELAEKLTTLGLQVEEIKTIGNIPEGIVIAEILKRDKHPNADRLSICSVNNGKETLQIVCGAPNCDAGKKVPLATIGTVFKNEDGSDFVIKGSKLRGVDSFGMLCSGDELGIPSTIDGLLELPANAKIGEKLNTIYKSDTIYDLEITSNRPDWNSFIGVAREIQAITDSNKLSMPDFFVDEQNKELSSTVDVSSDSIKICPKYTARIIKNITVSESPSWLKDKLLSIGLRPINNIVDITNLVLFETGQPLHAFDLDKLEGNTINVRFAKENEKIKALDGKEYSLKTNHVVIADKNKSVAIAGIMGGEETGVTSLTQKVLLESAYFPQEIVSTGVKELGISSDSSYRFERGVDYNMVEKASNRATNLILQLAGGELSSSLITGKIKDSEFSINPKMPFKVNCNFKNIRSLLGITIANELIIEILKKLDLSVELCDSENFIVSGTTFRLDIEREADIAEEILRIYGLDKIPIIPVKIQSASSFRSDSYALTEKIRNSLISFGLNECINYTLIDKKQIEKAKLFETSEIMEVINPISSESSALRPSLLFGLLKAVSKNISYDNHNLKLFEIGTVYTSSQKQEESQSCCLIITGKKHPEMFSEEKKNEYDFFDLKGLLETLFLSFKIKRTELEKHTSSIFKKEVSGQISFNIDDKKHLLATFGELSSNLTAGIRLKSPVFAAEINLSLLENIIRTQAVIKYEQVPIYPATSRDIAIVAECSLDNSDIISCIKSTNTPLLETIELFDLYEGESIGSGKRSLAYSLIYRSNERTLTDDEVNKAHDRIRKIIAEKLPIELR